MYYNSLQAVNQHNLQSTHYSLLFGYYNQKLGTTNSITETVLCISIVLSYALFETKKSYRVPMMITLFPNKIVKQYVIVLNNIYMKITTAEIYFFRMS